MSAVLKPGTLVKVVKEHILLGVERVERNGYLWLIVKPATDGKGREVIMLKEGRAYETKSIGTGHEYVWFESEFEVYNETG